MFSELSLNLDFPGCNLTVRTSPPEKRLAPARDQTSIRNDFVDLGDYGGNPMRLKAP